MSRFDRIQSLMKTPLDTLGERRRKLMDELRARPEVETVRARIDRLVERVPESVRAPLREDELTLDALRRAATAAGDALGAALRGERAPAEPETAEPVEPAAEPAEAEAEAPPRADAPA